MSNRFLKISFLLLLLAADAGTCCAQFFSGTLPDDSGHPVNAHGAGILYDRGVYYLFGEVKNGRTWLVPGQQWEDYRVPAGGVSCYASTDLVHWKYRGLALAPVKGDPENDLDTGRVIERPKVIYNAKTGKYVMWMHIDKKDYSYSRAGVAISDRPEGPYRFLYSMRPNGQMSRDMTIFQDEDGSAYLFYSSEQNLTMHVCRLSADYLHPGDHYSRILVGRNREAPALFRHAGKYYLVTSACTGWAPNAASCAVADRPLGPYREIGNPCRGAGAGTTFESQSTYILPLPGRKDTLLFMADRWNKRNLPASDYLWLPLVVKGGTVRIAGRP